MALFKDAVEKFGLYMEVQKVPSIKGLQAFQVQRSNTWMDQILSYIKDGHLPLDPFETKKIKVRATRFTVVNDELYKRGFSFPYLKCLNPEEAVYVLQEIHEGVCESHSGPLSLVGKEIKEGYFWPTMQKGAVEIVKKYDNCQRFGNVQHIRGELMTIISSPWPFSTWGLTL